MIYTGEVLTEHFEGLRLVAYQDSAGVWTCGYGHISNVDSTTTCTQEIAQEWLMSDIQSAADCVNRVVTIQLNQDEFNALVDFVFNEGCGAFSGSTMLKLLNEGNYSGAAEQFQLWNVAGGQVLAGLIARRAAEEQEFNGNTPDFS